MVDCALCTVCNVCMYVCMYVCSLCDLMRRQFSANLGYLFTELPLPEAIHAAKASGFDAGLLT